MLLKLYQGQAHIDMIVWNGHLIWAVVCIDIIVCTAVQWMGCRLLSRISPPRRLCDTQVVWGGRRQLKMNQTLCCLVSTGTTKSTQASCKLLCVCLFNLYCVPDQLISLVCWVTSCHLSSQNETIPYTTTVIQYKQVKIIYWEVWFLVKLCVGRLLKMMCKNCVNV